MITITRRLAGQLRVVFRKALNMTRSTGPALHFATSPGGIRVRARFADAAVEYHVPGKLPLDEMWVPFELLSDVEARRDEPVQIEMLGDRRVLAGWRDGNVPQMVQYDPVTPPDTDDFPETPETLIANPPGLLQALHDAMLTTDPDAARYATDHIQVRGKSGTLAATDGRQMLLQDGFEFPWEDDVLIPRAKVFGSDELPQDKPVAVGKTDDWVAVRVGPWTIWLKIEKKKRFPVVDQHVPRAKDAASGCRLSAADAEFLTQNLPKLPCDEEYNFPVTLDLNGRVAVRAKAADQPRPTELVLSGSQASGEPMRINTNRRFLARAVKLGFSDVHLYTPKVPVMCRDDHRRYVWALLNAESAIAPADDVIRITSADAGPDVQTTNRKPRKRKTTMPQPTSNGNGQGKANGHTSPQATTSAKSDGQGFEVLIEQAEATKVSLRESLSKTGELISALKRHRKQSKLVQSTLQSLRRLQAVDA